MMAAAETATSSSVVEKLLTEMRMTAWSRHVAPPSQHVPSSCTRRDHRPRPRIVVFFAPARRGETHQNLIEHHVVEHADAGFGREELGEPARVRTRALDDRDDTLATQ